MNVIKNYKFEIILTCLMLLVVSIVDIHPIKYNKLDSSNDSTAYIVIIGEFQYLIK